MDINHTFLGSIAEHYHDILKTDSSSICFVFPSRRAGVFFTDYISKIIDTPIFAPRIVTINDLFADAGSYITADQITLLFTLHRIYQQVMEEEAPFDEFLPWGEMILADFDDIDKYMVDADTIFRNLIDYKALDDDYSHLTPNQRKAIESFWGAFHLERLSKEQKKFLDMWTKLPLIYNQFKEELKAKNLAYAGMQYFETANRIKQHATFDNGSTTYVFAGFNALTTSEHILFKFLQKQNRAHFFWDYSSTIIQSNTPSQASGAAMFLSENILRYPAPRNWAMPVNNSFPEITITAVAHPMEQNGEITRFLKNEYTDDQRSAVVLTDENMLIPVLYSIPDPIEKVNVTMGYPLRNSPAYGLVDLLYQLQKNSRNDKSETWFNHRNVLSILQHPYITINADIDTATIRERMLNEKMIYVPSAIFAGDNLLSSIFKRNDDASKLSAYLKNIVAIIFNSLSKDNSHKIEREFINTLYTALNRFEDILLKNNNIAINPETWFKLFRSIAEIQTVSFKGEPLGGLQIMGILETRAVDFEKLIILDMNEGVYPKTNAANTFIPYGLRTGFGLPTIEFQDNIFAYYFFRLIHRAKKVELLYSAAAGSEMSRFLFQLKYQFDATPMEQTSVQPVNLLKHPVLSVIKDDNIITILEKYIEGGNSYLSPSAISQYIECPLRFYFDKVAGIVETEEVAEEADARIFGKIFHEVLEDYYTPYKKKIISSEIIDKWLNDDKEQDKNIRKAFSMQLGNQAGKDIQGKNIIIFEVIKNYIKRFFEHEKSITPFVFIDAERKIKAVYTTPSGLRVNSGGVIDRLHLKDGKLYIIDYKTGKGKHKIDSIDALFDNKKHNDNKAVFQTMMYGLLTDYTAEGAETLQPGVMWMKMLFDPGYSTDVTIKGFDKKYSPIDFEEHKNQYAQGLGTVIDEIFDRKVEFTQTENEASCRYCTFKELCGKG